MQSLRTAAGREIVRFCADTRGATAIEYAMIAAGVGAFIAATVMGLGSSLKETFYDKLANLFS
ncbi:MAG: Flp family type IVb pilin [Alphaproteobacteria bacterium]|nr:Flp family type IVb pilin [Alphaproteobacteria bacterium]